MIGYQKKFWGCSSVGRTPALQAGGRQFEPDQLHQNKIKPSIWAALLPCIKIFYKNLDKQKNMSIISGVTKGKTTNDRNKQYFV